MAAKLVRRKEHGLGSFTPALNPACLILGCLALFTHLVVHFTNFVCSGAF